MAPVAVVSVGALTFLVLPINEIVLYVISMMKMTKIVNSKTNCYRNRTGFWF